MFLLVRIVSKVKKYFPIEVKKVLNTDYYLNFTAYCNWAYVRNKYLMQKIQFTLIPFYICVNND